MKNCKECIHFEVCAYVATYLPDCDSFKDKSKIIEVPCAPGDILYDTRTNYTNVKTDVVRSFEVCKIDFVIVPWETWYARDVHSYELGKTVFTTIEEAEKRLKELHAK